MWSVFCISELYVLKLTFHTFFRTTMTHLRRTKVQWYLLLLTGDGDWLDIRNQVIKFDPEEWGIPYWDAKLYGGQQFERLLSEFCAVAKHTEVPSITVADVATATGLNKLNNVPNYAWAVTPNFFAHYSYITAQFLQKCVKDLCCAFVYNVM